MSKNTFDPRVTPARQDLAAAHLQGKVDAGRFVQGREFQAAKGRVALRHVPSDDAPLDSELRFGERFTAYEEKDGWLWGQATLDSYVGYAWSADFAAPSAEQSHRVTVLSTPLLLGADVKRPARDMLPMNARVAALEQEGRFARLSHGYVFAAHLAPLSGGVSDWVGVAERYLGVPYLWGGVTSSGLDCSGLIQNALIAANIESPRDTDMMEAALGTPVLAGANSSNLKRGDIVFWKGHAGIMLDGARLIHANAFHMQVTIEPLEAVAQRIAPTDGAVRAVKRL